MILLKPGYCLVKIIRMAFGPSLYVHGLDAMSKNSGTFACLRHRAPPTVYSDFPPSMISSEDRCQHNHHKLTNSLIF